MRLQNQNMWWISKLLNNSKASTKITTSSPKLSWNFVRFTVCSVRDHDSQKAGRWVLKSADWTMCLGTPFWGPLLQCVFFLQWLVSMEIYTNERSFQSWRHCTGLYDTLIFHDLHTLHPAARQRAKEDAMRAHNIGFYKPSHWHGWCQVIFFCWWSSSLLDVHFKLSIITGYGLAIMFVFDVVVGFVLLVLSQDIWAGHSRNDRQVSRGSLGNGRVTSVQ